VGITSSSCTRKPARAAARASQRPSGPAPMMATVSDNGCGDGGEGLGNILGAGLGGERFGDIVGVGAGVEQMFGDAGALLGGERGDGGQHTAQGDGDVVNIVHQADGFSGEWHGFPRWDFRLYCRGLSWGGEGGYARLDGCQTGVAPPLYR